ncbi:hypothetical protein, partial [Actinophytocola sp.]|uniref:hypothetical protein n=1 Tax=Actinophytocola sp. TaxID=1872138 RepID=UPI003899F557
MPIEETHTVVEPHRTPHLPNPILRSADLIRHITGHIRHHRNACLAELDVLSDRTELVQHRLHPGRMKSMRHAQPRMPPPPRHRKNRIL